MKEVTELKIVPLEPTNAMIGACAAAHARSPVEVNPLAIYRAMLAAAPGRASLAAAQVAAPDERWWSPPDSFGTSWLTNGAALHPLTANLVVRFARALACKLAAAEVKYGYSDGWRSPDWMDECRTKLQEHVTKGDPRDVAAYCAFLWHHEASTAGAAQLPSPWQTIDSAPKDGTWLLLWEQYSDKPFVGCWMFGRWTVSHEHVDAEGGWNGAIVVDCLSMPVTHWMRLPAEPAALAASTKATK